MTNQKRTSLLKREIKMENFFVEINPNDLLWEGDQKDKGLGLFFWAILAILLLICYCWLIKSKSKYMRVEAQTPLAQDQGKAPNQI